MNGAKNNNYFHTILFVVLAILLLSFTNKKEESSSFGIGSSIQLCINEHSQIAAIASPSIKLPICASLVDESHSIQDYSSTCNHFSYLIVSRKYTISQEKFLSIKPLLTRTLQRILFPSTDDGNPCSTC